LDAVFQAFKTTGFLLAPRDRSVMVMDGKDEGPYAWLTVNFLLGTIGNKESTHKTAAIIDMGGGSTQIVFVPDDATVLGNAPVENLYSTSFRGVPYTMYQNSHLELGLKEAAAAAKRLAHAESVLNFQN